MIQNVFFPLRVLLLTIHYVVFVCLSVLFIASASASCLVLSCRVYFFPIPSPSHLLSSSSRLISSSSPPTLFSVSTAISFSPILSHPTFYLTLHPSTPISTLLTIGFFLYSLFSHNHDSRFTFLFC